MSKLSIEGHIIGTDADKVDYGKNNNPTVEDALDALFNGAGSGTQVDGSVLSLLEPKFIKQGGINSAPWSNKDYLNIRMSPNRNDLNGWENTDKYININQVDTYGDSVRSVCFRIFQGDVIHYNDLGGPSWRPIVVTDLDYKVMYAGDAPASGVYVSGTYNVVQDGWVFAVANFVTGTQNPYIYTQWTERKALKTKPVYAAYGDSITADADDWRPVCYPRIVANLMGAESEIHARAGSPSEVFLEPSWNGPKLCRMDADIISINTGVNDSKLINQGRYLVGDADDVIALDLSDDFETLSGTFIGRYRICVEQLLARAPKAIILCVTPIGIESGYPDELADICTQISDLVTLMNNQRVRCIDGSSLLSYLSGSIFFTSTDHVHPNELGQIVIAYQLYDKHIKKLLDQ